MLYIVSHSGLATMIEIHTRARLSKSWVGGSKGRRKGKTTLMIEKRRARSPKPECTKMQDTGSESV